MSSAIVTFARNIVDEELYGDMEYYMEVSTNRGNAISLLADYIEVQDEEIKGLKERINALTDKLIEDKK